MIKPDLFVFLALGLAFASAGPLTAASAVELVRDGEATGVIVVAADASPEVRAAAMRMLTLIEHATGATLPLGAKPIAGQAALFVGHSPELVAFGLDQSALSSDDSFDIAFPAPDTVVILGRGDSGTRFGVHEFLERYVGVRWLMPGPGGTDVPKCANLSVPSEPVRQTPSFDSRQLEIPDQTQRDWAQNNRMITRLLGQAHWLNRLFSWQEHTAHPEYFPLLRDGTRYVPTGPQGWQPCFDPSVTGTAAIERIAGHFSRQPGAHSYALSINDSPTYCRCAFCEPKLDEANYSNVFWPWVNAVAEGVTARHPGKRFGALAYNNVVEPPTGDVHPAVVPFMTYDRHKWIHPEVRRQGEDLTRRWAQKVPELAWYEYIYGQVYQLPRVNFHQMAETLRFGHANHVRHYYAEAYPNFGEGPKLYVLLKLLWDVNADVDAILEEWYTRVGGAEAAPYLAKYYAFWEDFWTRRILDSAWFRQAGTYMPFFTDGYLLDVRESELAECRSWMEQALALTQTEAQRTRVQSLLTAFDQYELSALIAQASQPPVVTGVAQAMDALDRTVRVVDLNQKANRTGGPAERGLFGLLLPAARWASANPDAGAEVVRRLDALVADHADQPLGQLAGVAMTVARRPEALVEVSRNGGFEEGALANPGSPTPPDWEWLGTPADWYCWISESAPNTRVERVGEQAHGGVHAMKISAPGQASLLHIAPAAAGELFLVSVMLNANVEDMAGSAGFAIQWLRADGKWLGWGGSGSEPVGIQPGGETAGWKPFDSTLIRAPAGAAALVVNIGLRSVNENDFLMIDDVSVKRIVVDNP